MKEQGSGSKMGFGDASGPSRGRLYPVFPRGDGNFGNFTSGVSSSARMFSQSCMKNLAGSPIEPVCFKNMPTLLMQFPMNALVQRLLVEPRFIEYRSNFNLMTPFRCLFKEWRREGVMRLYQGIFASISHLIVRDGWRLVLNGLFGARAENIGNAILSILPHTFHTFFVPIDTLRQPESMKQMYEPKITDSPRKREAEIEKHKSEEENKRPAVYVGKLVLKIGAEILAYPFRVLSNQSIFSELGLLPLLRGAVGVIPAVWHTDFL